MEREELHSHYLHPVERNEGREIGRGEGGREGGRDEDREGWREGGGKRKLAKTGCRWELNFIPIPTSTNYHKTSLHTHFL